MSIDRQVLLEAIQDLTRARSEADRDAAAERAEALAPHAQISDLVFWGERDRTNEEIADEVILRERIWSEDGEIAMRNHMEARMREALADTTKPDTHYTKIAARVTLRSIARTYGQHG